MAASEILTLRLDAATSQKLRRLSKVTDRTRSRLAAEAIARYLEDNACGLHPISWTVR
jgi:predicted transcriptional regulator